MSDQNTSGGDQTATNDAAQTASQPGDSATQTAQGDGAPEPNAPDSGGDQTQQAAAPQEPEDVDAKFDKMNGIHKKGYRQGREKGKFDFAQAMGFDSPDAAIAWKKQQEREAEVATQDHEAKHAAALRTLQEKTADLEGRLSKANDLNARFQSQSAAALRAEVRSRAAGMGVIPDAADDFVSIVEPELAWAADGQSIVVMTTIDGETQASHETLDDYLARKKTAKPFLFTAKHPSGSGSENDADPKPRQTVDPQKYDFNRMKHQWTGGGGQT